MMDCAAAYCPETGIFNDATNGINISVTRYSDRDQVEFEKPSTIESMYFNSTLMK
jgi:hypothetical protein